MAVTVQVRLADDIAEIRRLISPTPYTDIELARVLLHVNDFDLARTAILMAPRPRWVHQVAVGEAPVHCRRSA